MLPCTTLITLIHRAALLYLAFDLDPAPLRISVPAAYSSAVAMTCPIQGPTKKDYLGTGGVFNYKQFMDLVRVSSIHCISCQQGGRGDIAGTGFIALFSGPVLITPQQHPLGDAMVVAYNILKFHFHNDYCSSSKAMKRKDCDISIASTPARAFDGLATGGWPCFDGPKWLPLGEKLERKCMIEIASGASWWWINTKLLMKDIQTVCRYKAEPTPAADDTTDDDDGLDHYM